MKFRVYDEDNNFVGFLEDILEEGKQSTLRSIYNGVSGEFEEYKAKHDIKQYSNDDYSYDELMFCSRDDAEKILDNAKELMKKHNLTWSRPEFIIHVNHDPSQPDYKKLSESIDKAINETSKLVNKRRFK